MSKRNALKAKLKAADRRRRKRQSTSTPVATSEPPGQSTDRPSKGADVVGIISSVIVADFHRGTIERDTIATAAIRGFQNSKPPKSDEAKRLYEKILAKSESENLLVPQLRSAANDLLELASQHHDNEAPNSFLRYLALLNE